MRALRRLGALVLFIGLIMTAVFVALAQAPRMVDDAALADARVSAGEWVSYNGSWMEQRFSPLYQINALECRPIGVAWSHEYSGGNRQSAEPPGRDSVWFSTAFCTASLRGASSMRWTREPAKSAGIPIPKSTSSLAIANLLRRRESWNRDV